MSGEQATGWGQRHRAGLGVDGRYKSLNEGHGHIVPLRGGDHEPVLGDAGLYVGDLSQLLSGDAQRP